MNLTNGHVARYNFWEGRFWSEMDPIKKQKISRFLAALVVVAAAAGVDVLSS